jgi:hypothetical protein
LNETKSAGLTVIVPNPDFGTITVTSNESSRFPEPSIPIASILVPSGTPLLEPPWKSSDAEKKPVDGLYDATSRGVTVTVAPSMLIGSAAVVSIVSRVCVALTGKYPVTFTSSGSPVKLVADAPEPNE